MLSEGEPRHSDGEHGNPCLSPLYYVKVHHHLLQSERNLALQFKRNSLFELARASKWQREQAVGHHIPWDTGEHSIPTQVVRFTQLSHLLGERTLRVALLAKEPEHPGTF